MNKDAIHCILKSIYENKLEAYAESLSLPNEGMLNKSTFFLSKILIKMVFYKIYLW